MLGAYDVGAVEVTLAEYTADGGVWNAATTANNPESLLNTGTIITVSGAASTIFMLCAVAIARQKTYRHYRATI